MINTFWEYLITQERLAETAFYKPDWFSVGIYKGMVFLFLLVSALSFLVLVYLSLREFIEEKKRNSAPL